MIRKNIKRMTIFLIVIVAIILLKNQYSSLLLQNASYGMPALIKRQNVENLFLGSSMFRQGIDIQELNAAFPDKNYILAYNGNQPATEYLELKNLLENDVKIKNLYVDMYVYSAWEQPEISDEKLLLETTLSQKWSLYRTIFPTVSPESVQYLWELFITSNNELLLTWPLNYFILNRQFLDGGSLIAAEPASLSVLDSYVAPEIDSKMNSTQELYLNSLITLAGNYDCNLIFVETPKYSTITNDSAYLNAMAEYCSFLENKQVSYIISDSTYNQIGIDSTAYALSYNFEYNNTDYFTDAFHLSSIGKKHFTQTLLFCLYH